MRLKHIKLSGFKSFVDPTKVPFEQQMTAIVGPNGCGKSNIIDAVRWVLGESSAKNLRGDAMTDVIFNGAASRKPVGQASVELVFDNIDHRIQGHLADRAQVSVRRIVNRDGQNSYYLNGSKCRRRDITDIFLGTGLGPRSYAIIEQGTISRLIESKPQELRVFIEEAAGISKYKERRKETEQRIRHTRENLARLTDLRVELSTQIEKLFGQAEAAKQFKKLKSQERKFKAELAFLRWKKFDNQHAEHEQKVVKKSAEIEELHRQQKSVEIELFTLKQQSSEQYKLLTAKQNEKLHLTQKIAHAEQNSKHVKQQTLSLDKDNQTSQQQLINAQNLLLQEKEKVSRNQQLIKDIQPKLNAAANQENRTTQVISSLVAEKEQLEQFMQQHREQAKQTQAQRIALKQKIAKTEVLIEQGNERLKQLAFELIRQPKEKDSPIDGLSLQLETVKHEAQAKEAEQTEIKAALAELQQLTLQRAADVKALEKNIDALEERKKEFAEHLAISDNWLENICNKLDQCNIAYLGTVQSNLNIAAGWEKAVQLVLNDFLPALWVKELPTFDITESLHLIKHQPSQAARAGTLAEKVSNSGQFSTVLNRIYIVEPDAEDISLKLASLEGGESLITQGGVWISNEFLRIGELHAGNQYLTDVAALNRTVQQLEECRHQIAGFVLQVENSKKDIVNREQQLGLVSRELLVLNQRAIELDKQLSIAKHQYEQTQLQWKNKHIEQARVSEEKQQLSVKLAKLNSDLAAIDRTEADSGDYSEDELHGKIKQTSTMLDSENVTLSQIRQQKHDLALALQKESSIVAQSEASIIRLQENIKHLIAQQDKTQSMLNENRQTLQQDENNLAVWLQEISAVESSIIQLQAMLSQEQTDADKHESQLKLLAEKLKQLEKDKSQLMLDSEGAKLRASSAMEQLAEIGVAIADVKESIPANAKESQWQAQLIRISKDIANLGTINLAAIEEYESQFARKNYLDKQDQDLNFAISTLESAIEKIDKESRQKFKATFDIVNKDLKQLFPKVFGGGQAYLELTGDDLLETGVTIMARPPGKKNSTIHLLSGGEKALTALSLVFAIFRLNPAPFCMLDEVDAPLDDANVERFCNLVREMSNTVQFIYISHNKIAMEMATHLTGVTMFEPGVSRMVAVDIDEAIAMAEVS